MKKKMVMTFFSLAAVIVLIPSILVGMESSKSSNPKGLKDYHVKIYLSEENKVVSIPLESYVRGVVAFEMPALFHKEALKAQAIAARTYIANRVRKGDFSDLGRWGQGAKGAQVTDTISHQVYLDKDKLRSLWGKEYEAHIKKINDVISETRGKVLTYNNEPIYAAFFSTSNGKTESSEEYFSASYPYLKSVDSSWDLKSPKYKKEFVYSIHDIVGKIKAHSQKSLGSNLSVNIMSRTKGNYIKEINISGHKFTGRQIREALSLPSSDFDLYIRDNKVSIKTRGYGHGVGMSQWGANLLAKMGKTAKEILLHYYQGVEIRDIGEYLDLGQNI